MDSLSEVVTYESMGFNLRRLKEQRERRSESLAKKRSRLSSAKGASVSVQNKDTYGKT